MLHKYAFDMGNSIPETTVLVMSTDPAENASGITLS